MKPERFPSVTLQGEPLWSAADAPPPATARTLGAKIWPHTLSLFAQTLGMTILALLAAIALCIVVIFNLPPPVPDFYRMSEIAQTLKTGRTFTSGDRPPLVRESQVEPPAGHRIGPHDFLMQRQELGRLLGVDPERIVLIKDMPRFKDNQAIQLVLNQLARGSGSAQQHFLIAPFIVSVPRVGGGWLTVEPRRGLMPSPWQQRLLLWLGLSLLALIPLAYLFARRLAAPIAAFAEAAERLGRDPRAPPLTLHGPSEVGVAVRAFNEMQRRLARYVDDRTAMIGAIAHDLRTPLTRLRFRLEEAPEAVRGKMVADIAEMEAMIAAAIAFVRDASTPAQRSRLELSSLLESLADDMNDTGLDATVERSERVVVDGDPVALRRLFNNLLDNAIKFGGAARVRITAQDGSAVVRIDDPGLGLPEEELEKVFEPFYRCEQSRSRESGGIGLGLPVVRSIARAHGGDATLTNRPGGGLTATVILPMDHA